MFDSSFYTRRQCEKCRKMAAHKILWTAIPWNQRRIFFLLIAKAFWNHQPGWWFSLTKERGCLTKERFRQIAQRKRKLSLRTSDRCHWCGNPPRFFESVSGGFPSDRGIPTKVVRYFLGMTVLLFVQFFFSETAPLCGVKDNWFRSCPAARAPGRAGGTGAWRPGGGAYRRPGSGTGTGKSPG